MVQRSGVGQHDSYLYYYSRQLQAVRSGQWKLHLPHGYRSLKGKPGSGGTPGPYIQKKTGLALFDLKNDIGESIDVAAKHPKIVARLKGIAAEARKDLGDNGRRGKGQREPGKLRE